MKIIQLGYVFLPVSGGEEIYISELSKLLEKEGYKQTIIQRGFKSVFNGKKRIMYSDNITVEPVTFLAPSTPNGPVLDRQPLYNILAIPKILKTATKGDIIIVHYPQLFFPAAWLAKILKGARTICVSHGITWDKPKQNLKEKLLYASVKLLNKLALASSDSLVANDTCFVREAKQLRKGSETKIKVIYNFVDIKQFKPKKKKGKQKIILCPRNLRQARGVDLAIKAMTTVNSAFKDAKLLILGDGPLRAELEAMIKKLRVNAEIRPFAEKKQLIAHYNNSDVVIIPSRYSEGTSLAGLEAMSCGKPLVVTNIGGLPDIVKDGENGNIRSTDPEELGNAIVNILKNKKLAEKMGKNSRKMAETMFSYEKWSESWIEAVRELELK